MTKAAEQQPVVVPETAKHVTIAMYQDHLDENLTNLGEELRKGISRPQAIRRHFIPKPGSQEKRPLGIPTVRDRVVQTALRMVSEPTSEREFAEHSYGFRPHRGCKDALRRVEELLKAGYTSIVDADLKSGFDTIPHDRLLALVAQKVTDGSWPGSKGSSSKASWTACESGPPRWAAHKGRWSRPFSRFSDLRVPPRVPGRTLSPHDRRQALHLGHKTSGTP